MAEGRVAERLAPLELAREEARPHRGCRRGGAASRPAGTSGRATRPGASRPLRPASCVTSWNVRSSARKSGSARPVSASTTAASATPGKWWPFATICVPMSTARSARAEPLERIAKRARAPRDVPRRAGSARAREGCRSSSVSSRCVPAPMRASSTEPHAGHCAARARARPQWWQWRTSSAWSVSATSQSAQRRDAPHARQCTAGATPRRLRSRIARPPSLDDAAERAEQRRRERVAGLPAEIDQPHARHGAADPRGQRRPLGAAPSSRAAASPSRRPRRPPRARRASPRPSSRRSAGRTPACTPMSCSSSTTISPTPRIGANTAERAPTTIRASPHAIRSRSSRLSASPSDGMEDRTRVAEPLPEPPDRLWRERDLGHEHDRPEPALERRRARLEIDLGLAAARRPLEQDVLADALVERRDDLLDRGRLVVRQRGRLRLAVERVTRGGRRPLAARRPTGRRDELERPRRRRAVVVGEPEREVDERRRDLVELRPTPIGATPGGASTPTSATTPRTD